MRSSGPDADGALVLYTSRYCGYSYRVMATVKLLALSESDLAIVDVGKRPERRLDIVRGTGRRTVPVLRIEQPERGPEEFYWLFDSGAIVRYLRTRFAHPR